MQNNEGLDYNNSITVITPTRQRVSLLQRVIESVKSQDCRAKIEHLILIDDCRDTLSFAEKFSLQKFHFLEREATEISGPARLGKIRNFGVNQANSRWIAFLDDDNEYERNHLSSLLEAAKSTKRLAIHSQSKLFNSDGTPFLEQRLPWSRDRNLGKIKYEEFRKMGIVTPGSNVIKSGLPANLSDNDSTVNFVDTNEWLIDRELLLKYSFVEHYDMDDWRNLVTEDDKLLNTLISNKVAIACTNMATVKYYLGGYSNHNVEFQKPGEWVTE